MSDWTDETRARLVREEERLRYKAANLQGRGKTVMAAQELVVADDIRAALGEIERLTEKLQQWSDWEAMLHAQLERVVGGSGRGCDSLVETLRLRLLEREKKIDLKEKGYTAIIKMERDARDQFRERAEKAERERDEWKASAHVEAKGLRCTFEERAEKAEADRDEWRETARSEMAGRRAAEAKLAEAHAAKTRAEESELRTAAELDEAKAEVERLRDLIVALSEDERGLVTAEIHDEADRIRALAGGGE